MSSQQKQFKFYAGSPLSMHLTTMLYTSFWRCVEKPDAHMQFCSKDNYFAMEALYSFVLSINIWEAILNETFQNDFIMQQNNIFSDASEAINKWDIKTKTITFPKLLLNKTFDKGNVLWQDFNAIVGIRNEIIHFKSSLFEGPKKQVDYLRAKNLTVQLNNCATPWQTEVSTTECMRFCINTTVKMIHTFVKLFVDAGVDSMPFMPFKELYREISIDDVRIKKA